MQYGNVSDNGLNNKDITDVEFSSDDPNLGAAAIAQKQAAEIFHGLGAIIELDAIREYLSDISLLQKWTRNRMDTCY